MESSLASWQFENFSTAELSPPISPAPLSPSLYSYGAYSPNHAASAKDVSKNGGNEFLVGNRAQMATNLLRDIAHFESIEYKPETDLGLNWNEESVNLELFSELSELDYASPPTPASEEFTNQHNLSQFSETNNSLPVSSLEPSGDLPPEIYDQLSAEFQAILESLPGNTGNTSNEEFDDLIAISGLPIQFQDTQCITSTPNENIRGVNDSPNFMEVDLIGNSYSNMSCLDENSSSQAGSVFYSPSEEGSDTYSRVDISDEVLEENSEAAENILDALLLGNLSEAQSYLPNMQTLPVGNTLTIFNNSSNSSAELSMGIVKKEQRQNKQKVETNKRCKTTEGRRRGGMNAVADKSLRKKAQNKTAATRYRLKKKLEAVVTTEVETTMQHANDILQAETIDLARQITIVKQLLRDIMHAKKMSRNSSYKKLLH